MNAGDALGNLYRDLRDRRLLPVVLLLIVAIAAVPLLMRDGGEEPISRGSTGDNGLPGGQPSQLDPVVVTQAPELRAFRQRLASFQSTNPFDQVVPPPASAADEAAATETGDDLGITGGTPTDPSSAELPIDPLPVDPATVDPPATDTPPADVPPAGDDGVIFYSTRVDVRVGAIGQSEVLEDVKEFSFLPDNQRPVVEYLLGDLDLTSASFVVSPSVDSTEGDGECAPSPGACEFLLLDVGEEQSFVYEDGVRYRLKLLAVHLHEIPQQKSDLPEGAGRVGDVAAARTPAVLRGEW